MATLGVVPILVLIVGLLFVGAPPLSHASPLFPTRSSPSAGVEAFSDPKVVGASTVIGGVAAVSTDTSLANNEGINTTFDVPSSISVPSGTQAFVGVSESISGDLTASAGMGLDDVSILGTVGAATAILPNGTAVYTSSELSLGEDHTFSFTHTGGWWWTFDVDGGPITGSAGWENGTYNLGQASAEGIANGSTLPDPAYMIVETGTGGAFDPSEIDAPQWAIGIEKAGTSATTYQPRSADAVELVANPSPSVGIEGHLQLASLPNDAVDMGGSIAFPGNLAALWGSSGGGTGLPLGKVLVYSTEPALEGSLGLSFQLKVPSLVVPSDASAFLGALLPVNGTETVGVGLVTSNVSGVTSVHPYYQVGTPHSNLLYVDTNLTLAAANTETFQAAASASSWWWKFTVGGTTIATTASGAGNGSADLGRPSAVTIISSTPTVSNATFAYAEAPLFGLFGNISGADFVVASSLSVDLTGLGWSTPDYANAWTISAGVGIEGAVQVPTDPAGTVTIGPSVPAAISGEDLWKGNLTVTLTPSSTTIALGQTVGLNATVARQGGVALPSHLVVNNLQVGPGTLSGLLVTGTGTFPGTFTIPLGYSGTVPTTTTISLSVQGAEYDGGNASTIIQIVAPTLTVAVHLSPEVVDAGGSSQVTAWLNTSYGAPVAGATLTLNGIPSAWVGTVTSSAAGVYEIPITTSSGVTTVSTYTLGLNATADDATLAKSSLATLTVEPAGTKLPLAVSVSPTSSTVASGAPVNVTITVDSGDSPLAGAGITVSITPQWSGSPSPETTGSTGEAIFEMTAPMVSTNTTFLVEFTVTATGFATKTVDANVTVIAPPGAVPPSTPFFSLNNPEFLVLIAAIVAVIVVAIAAVSLRPHRPRQQEPPTEEGYPGYPAYPGPPPGPPGGGAYPPY